MNLIRQSCKGQGFVINNLKDKTNAARIACNKRKNVSILRNSKKSYYKNLDTKNITDNKKILVCSEAPLFKQSNIKHLYYIE